jgi:hypothetical protein
MKKLSVILLVLAVALAGCSKAVPSPESPSIEEPNVAELEEKIAALEAENRELKAQTEIAGIGIKSINIKSDEMTEDKAFYGDFAVEVTIMNNGEKPTENIKVVASLQTSIAHYQKMLPREDSKLQFIAKLEPGEEKSLTFLGFSVEHPEDVHEVVVNVISPDRQEDTKDDIKKVKLNVVFPPGSQD